MVIRFANNPLLTPEAITPSQDGFEVVGIFNPAVVMHEGECLMLARVAERPICEKGWVAAPMLDPCAEPGEYKLLVRHFRVDDPDVDASDPRVIIYRGFMLLTNISHLRLARSRDGHSFEVDPHPSIVPFGPEENLGIEDPRITRIGETCYINYSAVSTEGYTTALMATRDWRRFERLGSIFHPSNKDVAIFPEQVGGRYVALHRPDTMPFQRPSIWLAWSPDLLHWGGHRQIIAPREGRWDAQRIGGGAPPILTERGWLEIYHGVSPEGHYSLGALLLDAQDPTRILGRSERPVLEPESECERRGFFNETVFSDGLVQWPGEDEMVRIYYGAADRVICGAKISLDEIYETLAPEANMNAAVLEYEQNTKIKVCN